ncbi:MAG: HAD-IB family hydrolase [Actinomycetota bacterium]
MKRAAVFDLDRTLLSGGSGPVIAAALRRVGLGPDRSLPGGDAIFRFYEVVGETYPSMLLARQAASLSRGWPVEEVGAAAEAAAKELDGLVLPYARAAIEEHREAGDRLVLATTTPEHLVAPFAARLGFDTVVATRYGVSDGAYDGSIDGDFMWGRAKARGVRAWAEHEQVDLRSSSAYSDSYYDVPLLSAVGHPTAVNPDARLAAIARLREWPIRYFDAPEGVPKVAGLVEPQQVAMPLAMPELLPLARLRITGVEHLPDTGGAIIAFNHRSYFDSTAMAYLLSQHGRPARFLGKKEVFDAPLVGQIARWMGGIRVDRGTGSDEPLELAAEALRAGELVSMAPQGTIPRGPAFFETELRARWGCARLAAMSGAPVIPVGLWGTEQVWPRSQRLPTVPLWWRRPEVLVTVGAPVTGLTGDADADTTRIMEAIVDLLPPEAREPKEPTREELLATFPPGYDGDPSAESDRRPGTDT